MSYRRPIRAALATTLLVVAAVACSSSEETDTQVGAPASAGSAGAGDVTPVSGGDDAGSSEEYTLAQRFDLSIEVTSTEFNERRRIPKKYGCTREDISPPIAWSDPPEGTVGLALVVDSNQHPGPRWAHWVLWGIPPAARELPETVPNTPEAPVIGPAARQGTNSEDKVGWSGPCPEPNRVPMSSTRPPNTRDVVKKYTFRLYALDTDIELGPDATREDLLRAMDGHIIAGGELTGEQVGEIIRF